MEPFPLPGALRDGPFAVADARALGVGPQRLRRGDLVAPTRGARCHGSPLTTHDRASAFLPGLPGDAVFSHVTAARLWNLPLPRDLEARPALDVMTHSGAGPVQRQGCRGHRGTESRTLTTVDGLPVVGVADTWCDLGDLGRRRLTVEDLVVAGDAAVTAIDEVHGVTRADSVGVAALSAALAVRVRPRGALALRQALTFVRPGVRSAQESRARLLFVVAGLPEPEVNVAITDEHGEFLGEGDLVWREPRVVAEYQGEEHTTRRRRSEDSFRRETAGDARWTVHEVWAEDLSRPARRHVLVQRVARSVGHVLGPYAT